VELDRHLARAVDLEDARRDVAVERELRVGVVVHEDDVVLAAAPHDVLEVVARRDRGGGVVRVVEVQDARAAHHLRRDLVQVDEEVRARPEGVPVRLPAGEQRAALVRVVARLRQDPHGAGLQVREGEVGDPLLRPISGTTSVSGSKRVPKRRSIHAATASR
jgi:hypothetical protein